MVIINASLDEMLEKLEDPLFVRYDYIIPVEYPRCPPLTVWKPPGEFVYAPNSVEEIPPNSDLWIQFVMEYYDGDKKIMNIINERKRKIGQKPVGEYILCVALENAFYHGNKNNPMLPVSVKVFEGKKGVLVRVRDSGVGFDYKKNLEQFKKLEDKGISLYSASEGVPPELKFFSRRGHGFYAYYFSSPKIFFEGNGSTVNILFEDKPQISEILKLM